MRAGMDNRQVRVGMSEERVVIGMGDGVGAQHTLVDLQALGRGGAEHFELLG